MCWILQNLWWLWCLYKFLIKTWLLLWMNILILPLRLLLLNSTPTPTPLLKRWCHLWTLHSRSIILHGFIFHLLYYLLAILLDVWITMRRWGWNLLANINRELVTSVNAGLVYSIHIGHWLSLVLLIVYIECRIALLLIQMLFILIHFLLNIKLLYF